MEKTPFVCVLTTVVVSRPAVSVAAIVVSLSQQMLQQTVDHKSNTHTTAHFHLMFFDSTVEPLDSGHLCYEVPSPSYCI